MMSWVSFFVPPPSLALLLHKEDENGEVSTKLTEMTNGKKQNKWKAKVRKNRCHIVAEAKLSQFKLSFDRLATYVFPLLFFTFNLCYWAVYLVIMPYFIE